MKRHPLVSIIIPAYNRAELISETLRSVLDQTYENWECIIVDDHSKDHTVAVIKRFCERDPRFNLRIRPDDRLPGGNAARNVGVESSAGEFLLFLDSDDILSGRCLEERVACVKDAPDNDLWVFQTQVFSQTPGDLTKVWNLLHKPSPDLLRFVNQDSPWHTMAVLWRKDFFLKIGSFDEEIKVWQDWEVHIRALIGDARVFKAREDHIDGFYRVNQDASSSITGANTSLEYKNDLEATIRKVIKMIPEAEMDPKLRRAVRNLVFKYLYNYYLKNGRLAEVRRIRKFFAANGYLNNFQLLLLVLLDNVYSSSLYSVLLIKKIIIKTSFLVSLDYLKRGTKSTHLKIDADDLPPVPFG